MDNNFSRKLKEVRYLFRDGRIRIIRWCQSLVGCCLGTIIGIMPQTLSRRIILLVAPLLLAVAVSAHGYFIPSSQIFGKVYYKGNDHKQVVALTFDDGPNDPYTSQILDVLDIYGIKATFFEVGKNVELYPETAKRLVADGHVIGNHSYSHDANHALTWEGIVDMQFGEQTIYKVVGVKPRLYRPPHSKKSPWELYYVRKNGMIEINWTLGTPELTGRSPAQEAQDIINKAHPGDIILLHDGYGLEHNNRHADKSVTVQALPIIIQKLEAEGFEFVTVPQLLDVTPYLN